MGNIQKKNSRGYYVVQLPIRDEAEMEYIREYAHHHDMTIAKALRHMLSLRDRTENWAKNHPMGKTAKLISLKNKEKEAIEVDINAYTDGY